MTTTAVPERYRDQVSRYLATLRRSTFAERQAAIGHCIEDEDIALARLTAWGYHALDEDDFELREEILAACARDPELKRLILQAHLDLADSLDPTDPQAMPAPRYAGLCFACGDDRMLGLLRLCLPGWVALESEQDSALKRLFLRNGGGQDGVRSTRAYVEGVLVLLMYQLCVIEGYSLHDTLEEVRVDLLGTGTGQD